MDSVERDEKEELFGANFIVGRTFKLVKIDSTCEDDANFIIDLRSRKLNNYLKTGSNSLRDQMKYLQRYQIEFERGEQIYFKILDVPKNIYSGVVRITELNELDSFGYESMVVREDVSPVLPTDVVLSIYTIGFEKLLRKRCGPFQVAKKNHRVLKWHEKIGMTEITNEDDVYYYLEVSSAKYFSMIAKYKKIGLGHVSFNRI